jgi:hypothetical protein
LINRHPLKRNLITLHSDTTRRPKKMNLAAKHPIVDELDVAIVCGLIAEACLLLSEVEMISFPTGGSMTRMMMMMSSPSMRWIRMTPRRCDSEPQYLFRHT